MKATELRIGNWIQGTHPSGRNFEGVVESISKDGTIIHYIKGDGGYSDQIEDLQPIHLTEEWLKKEPYGIKEWKGNGADYQPETSKTKQVFYYLSEDIYLVFETWSYRKSEDDEWINEYSCFISSLDTSISLTKQEVHVLQNLYFALTGEELTLDSI
jgi:hypothetical protein